VGASIDPQTGLVSWTPPYLDAGTSAAFTVSVMDDDGSESQIGFDVALDPDLLRVVAMTPTATGYDVRFNRAIDASQFNLFDGQGGETRFGVADAVLRDASGQPVAGSIVLHEDGQGYTFVQSGNPRTDGLLAQGPHTLSLDGRESGFTDTAGRAMDGDGDGVAGGIYTATVHGSAGGAIVSLAEFARGPGQAASLAGMPGGLPVRVSNAAGATSIGFTLDYDPALLRIDGVELAVSGATLVADFSVPGHLVVSVSGISGLESVATDLVRLLASVPATAPYGAVHVLDLGNVVVDGNAPTGALDDDGLHLVAYAGDATGDARYSAADVMAFQRVLIRVDSGFHAYPRIDPYVVGNVDGNSTLSSLDVRVLSQQMAGLPQNLLPEIPAIQEPALSLTVPIGLLAPAAPPPVVKTAPAVVPQVAVSVAPVGAFASSDAGAATTAQAGVEAAGVPSAMQAARAPAGDSESAVSAATVIDAAAGDIVSVPLNRDSSVDLAPFQLRLRFAPDTLEWVGLRLGAQVLESDTSVTLLAPGWLAIDLGQVLAQAQAQVREPGTRLALDFRIAPLSRGSLSLDLEWVRPRERQQADVAAPGAEQAREADPSNPSTQAMAPDTAGDGAPAEPGEAARVVADADGDSDWLGAWLTGQALQPRKEANAWRLFLPTGE
jgi:hypothetical protein